VLTVRLTIDGQGKRPAATLKAAGKSGPLTWTSDGRLEGTLRLPDIKKWWPHTHGTPTLHQVQVRLGDKTIDLGCTGFRSLEVDRGADGKGFALKVNGQKIFARGACWSAADLVSLASDRASLRPWLEQARDAHMNMLRVGGTMTYESDDFFALCDELVFSCGTTHVRQHGLPDRRSGVPCKRRRRSGTVPRAHTISSLSRRCCAAAARSPSRSP